VESPRLAASVEAHSLNGTSPGRGFVGSRRLPFGEDLVIRDDELAVVEQVIDRMSGMDEDVITEGQIARIGRETGDAPDKLILLGAGGFRDDDGSILLSPFCGFQQNAVFQEADGGSFHAATGSLATSRSGQ